MGIQGVLSKSAQKEEQESGTDRDEGQHITEPCVRDSHGDIAKGLVVDVAEGNATLGDDDQIHVQRVNQQHVDAHSTQQMGLFLEPLLQQHHEGQYEMQNHQCDARNVPTLGVTDQEILGFLRDIRIPNQEELRESHVGPEHREGKEQFAHDVEMLLVDDMLEVTVFAQQIHRDDDHCHRVDRATGEDVYSIHGREPGVVHPFQPVECGESNGQSENGKESGGATAGLEEMHRAGLGIGVLRSGKLAQAVNGVSKSHKEHHRAEIPKRQVHEPMFVEHQVIGMVQARCHGRGHRHCLASREITETIEHPVPGTSKPLGDEGHRGNVLAHRTVRVHPLIEVLLHIRAQQRNRENAQPRKHRTEVFHDATHAGSPTAVRNIVEQGPEATAEREGEEIKQCEHPGIGIATLVHFVRRKEQKVDAQKSADHHDREGHGFDLADLGRIQMFSVCRDVVGCDVVCHRAMGKMLENYLALLAASCSFLPVS